MDKIKQAVAKLTCGNTEGTAFLISESRALTVSHCILAAIEDHEEIILTFYNISDTETLSIKAIQLPSSKKYPVAILKLERDVHTEYLNLACYEDHIARGEKLVSYGYPQVKGEEGYPIDIYINDYLNKNVACDYDISLRIDGGDRVNDYSGMSGSPVIFRNQVVGLLIEERIECVGNNGRAIDLKVISNNSVKPLFEEQTLSYVPIKYIDLQDAVAKSQQPKEYQDNGHSYEDRKKNYKERFVIGYSECDCATEDYEKSIEYELNNIFAIKNKGDIETAWNKLLDLTSRVRVSKSKPEKMLSRLYYTRAIWYLDDKEDGGNAQKYMQKVLDINPDYDCRTYYAKKHYLEGNVIEEKKSLLPLDNVSILNTYLQMCIYKKEIEDALEAFENGKKMANGGTNYLMSLIYILDGDYELADQYLNNADEYDKDIPLYVMMHGVIMYWKMLPQNMIYGDCLLPPMYSNSMILLSDEIKRKINCIVELYKRAYAMAEMAKNIELQKQILVVWLNTLSISDEYQEEGQKIAKKLLELEEYQCQAIIYLYITGCDIPLSKNFEPKDIVKKTDNQIESMISCVYLALSKKDKKSAFQQLKEYRFKFQETHMMEHWFDLVIRACENREELVQLHENLEKCNLEQTIKSKIHGMFLEALGENELLLAHAESLYTETQAELDLINLINCCEKITRWDKAEQYSSEWDRIFHNPMAKIRVIRCLALQNKQEGCLERISELRASGEVECLTREVQFYEVQALKILGRYDEAISKGEELWNKVNLQKVLFLLAECYFLNVQEQDAIYILIDGMKKGIRSVEVYQMLAEYNKRLSTNEVEKYAKKACMVSDNDPHVMMWAMQLLYSIGRSEKASELFVKLQAMNEANCFRIMNFKEVTEWINHMQKESEKRYEMYMKCQFPYHLFIDSSGTASYALYCNQLWDYNEKSAISKQLLYVNYGGHKSNSEILNDSIDDSAILDFSTLIQLEHLDLMKDIHKCWKEIFISGNINSLFVTEQNKCLPNQPDMLMEKQNMMDCWKKKNLHYIALPSQETVSQWISTGIEPGDVVPYELAKANGAFYISDNFLSDLLEEPYKITEEMRNSVVSTNELLTALERRGDISSDLKNRYDNKRQNKNRNNVVDFLVSYDGKLPIYVDENFLREIFEMDALGPFSKKCEIFVIENIFQSTNAELERVAQGKKALEFLEQLKIDIKEYKEQDFIRYFGHYQDENKKDNGIYTNDLIDLIHFSSDKKKVLVCDDRWVNSYNNFGECYIFNSLDILELLHEHKFITDEKYVKVITQMFCEGYAYIIPPLDYMKILLWQIKDGSNIIEEIPEELSIMCNYMVYITASEICLNDEMIHQGVIPESAGYMYNLQRILLKLLREVWCAERSELWKKQISNWLLANYSVFTYKSIMNESDKKNNKTYYELELANFLFSGFCEIPADSYRKEYYNWLFHWLNMNIQWENGLEEKTIQRLAEIINDVYKHEKKDLYTEIGIGALILSVTEDMPDYYKNKIRNNPIIRQIIEYFENRFVFMGMRDFILREHFNQWIEDSMKQGIGNSITRMNELTKREYIIIFVADILYRQGFKIEFTEETGDKRTYYYRIDQAKILCDDELLRVKGLYALSEFISEQNMKQYLENINRSKLRDEVVKKAISETKSNESYIMYIVRYIFENEGNLFSIEELFPNDPSFFAKIEGRISEVEEIQKLNYWLQQENKYFVKIHAALVIYIHGYMKSSKKYNTINENNKILIAHYFSDKILTQIDLSSKSGRNKYTLEDISNYLYQLNDVMGFLDEIKGKNAIPEEELQEKKNEIITFFDINTNLQWFSSEILEICQKLYYVEREFLMQHLFKIKNWLISQWKIEDKQNEKDLLRIMEHIATLENIDDNDKIINQYLDLWDEIISYGFYIHISRESLYKLRNLIVVFDFKQGIRMRKIVEKISLQK